MIISGGSRCNWKFFAKHLMRSDENERVAVTEIKGLLSQSVPEAFREMDAVAEGTQCRNFFYHCNLNPREDERLTPAQWEASIDRLEHNLGLDGHARFVVEHEKHGRVHRHVVWSRIDVDSMTAVSDSFTAPIHERTAREIEAEYGLAPVESVLVKDRATERPERGPKPWENFRGKDSGIDPKAVAAEVSALWRDADSGLAFKSALEDAGYILAKGDRRDFVIIDQAGDDHSLTRRVGDKAANVRARMADVDRDALPSVAEARELARSAADSAASGSATAAETPGERRDLGEPEIPGGHPLEVPELAGARPPDAAAGGPVVRETSAGGIPNRVSPWGDAWRALADRAARYADRLHALLQDEGSGTPEEGRDWVTRVIGAGRDVLGGWRHRDVHQFTGGIEAAAALARDYATGDVSPSPEGGGGDEPSPGAEVGAPGPDTQPQEEQGGGVSASINTSDLFDALAQAWMEEWPGDTAEPEVYPGPEPDPHMPDNEGPDID